MKASMSLGQNYIDLTKENRFKMPKTAGIFEEGTKSRNISRIYNGTACARIDWPFAHNKLDMVLIPNFLVILELKNFLRSPN